VQITIIANGSKPASIRSGEIILRELQKKYDATLLVTSRKGDAINKSFEAAQKSDIIISLGGDGTISECTSGIAGAMEKSTRAKNCALLPVAMGTGNDFIKNLNIETTATSVPVRIENGRMKRIDIFCLSSEGKTIRYFVNECSAGMGPSVVLAAERMPNFIRGNLRFHLAIIRTFFSYRKKFVRIRTPEWQYEGKVISLVCANGKYFGGGLGIAPGAEIDDGKMDITIVGNIKLTDYLQHIPALRRSEIIHHPEIKYLRCTTAEIEVSDLEVDGEYISGRNFHITRMPYPIFIL
jgi:diacylglycerol kinase (ATP)